MGYQFIHLSGFARVAGKGKAGGHNIFSIAAEAERREGACPHIAAPQQPQLIFGVMPSEAVHAAQAWAEQSKDALGRGIRKDGLCLASGVISWPSDRPAAEWAEYRDRSVKWLQKQHGKRLLSVVEHVDELYPHIHFYAVPLPGERFDALHPGRAAAAQAKTAGLKKGEQNKAYKTAMRQWQTDFHREVSQYHGLTRLGPRRRRLTRAQWKAEQSLAEYQACELAHAARSVELIDRERAALTQAREIMDTEAQRLVAERKALEEIVMQMKTENAKRAKEIRTQAAQAFQAGIESRRRQKAWVEIRRELITPPAGLTYSQIERRQEFAKGWDFLVYPEDVRRRAVAANRQGGELLHRLGQESISARRLAQSREAEIRELQEMMEELKPLQIIEKSRLSKELQTAKQALAEAREEQKRLALAEKKLIRSCPTEVVEKFRHSKEKEREKALAELLAREAKEIEQDRQQREAESAARRERQAMRPAAKPKKPGGWVPPRPS